MKNKIRNLVKRDLIVGFDNNKLKFITIIILFIIMTYLNAINLKSEALKLEILSENINFVDLFFYTFKGASYDIGSLPIVWILIHIYTTYLIGSYCYDDLSKDSAHIIVKMKNRQVIWISKVIWMILTIVIFYIIAILVIALFTSIMFNTSFNWSDFSNKSILNLSNIDCSSVKFILVIILIYVLSSITLAILQMLVSLILKPKYIYIINISILVLALYIKLFLIPIQGSLILRQNIFNPIYPIAPLSTIIYNLVLFLILFIIGYKYMKKFDFLTSQNTD